MAPLARRILAAVVELNGQVVKADLVTIYVQNLGRGRTYAGTNFESLQIGDAPITVSADSQSNAGSNELSVWNFKVRSLTR